MAMPPIPMPGGPGAPPPPGMGGTGPATQPGTLAGNAQQGMAAVKTGLEALQKALPQLPMGSEIHTAVLKAMTDLGKHVEKAGGGDQAGGVQQLLEMLRAAKMNPNAQAALPAGGGGAPPPGGGMPPMPPMAE